jgi:hypothetical protein
MMLSRVSHRAVLERGEGTVYVAIVGGTYYAPVILNRFTWIRVTKILSSRAHDAGYMRAAKNLSRLQENSSLSTNVRVCAIVAVPQSVCFVSQGLCRITCKSLKRLVGATGLEPVTSCV